VQGLWIAPVAAAAVAWLWFLALGRTRGVVKRLMLRATLLALAGVLVYGAAQKGLLTRATPGFRLALLLAVALVAVGYLYLIRFCGACGRMVRNLKPAACPRCGAPLPLHGMTTRSRAADGEARRDPLGLRAQRSRPPEGPRA
jgi:hypothetical protein